MSLIFAKIEGKLMASPEKKGKLNTKLLAAIVIIIVVVSLSAVAAQYALTKPAATNGNLPAMTLTLVGSDGTTKTLTQTDIAALQAYTAQGVSRSRWQSRHHSNIHRRTSNRSPRLSRRNERRANPHSNSPRRLHKHL